MKPIVRVIDDWFTARPLGLIVEGKVGAGRIVVCGFDLTRDSEDPVSRQMRSSLLRYIHSKHFRPATDISPEQIASLIALPKETRLPGVRSIKADSQEEGNDAANAVDGDPETIWHTPWSGVTTGFPHELTVELVESRAIGGVKLLPRQDGNQNGWIAECELYVSADGRSWGQPVARTKLPAIRNEQEVKFAKAVTTRFVKLRALSGHADGPWASLAEIGLIPGQ